MSPWEVEILPDAERTLCELDPSLAERAVARLRWLAANLDVVHPVPLHGALAGFFKPRIGDRASCTRWLGGPGRRIHVHWIGHRDEIYKSGG